METTSLQQSHPFNRKDLAGKLHHFLTHTGFRNIRISEARDSTYFLVIVMVEDIPVQIGTFPIRFEVDASNVTIKLYFSHKNSVAVFPKDPLSKTHVLAKKLTDLMAPDYTCVYDGAKSQVHLIRVHKQSEFQQDCEGLLQRIYLESIQTMKWICEGLYYHLQFPGADATRCFEEANQRNPKNPTYPAISLKLPLGLYEHLIDLLNASKFRCFLTLLPPNESEMLCTVVQKQPLDFLSIREFARENPFDLSATLQFTLPLCLSAIQRGIPLETDMFGIKKSDRDLAVVLPEEGLGDNVELSVIRSIETVRRMMGSYRESSYDPLYSRLSGESFKLIKHISQWLITGEMCGLQVKLIFCPPTALDNPQFSTYLLSLRNLDFVEDIMGIMDFEGATYLVQRYFPSVPLTLAALKRLIDLLQALHRHKIYHGCISLHTICLSAYRTSLLLPCFHPAFYPLAATILSSERLNYSSFPSLLPYELYDIEPQGEELEAADTFAVCGLALQYCLRELGNARVIGILQAGVQGSARLEEVAKVLQEL